MGKPYVYRRPWDRTALRREHQRGIPPLSTSASVNATGVAGTGSVGTVIPQVASLPSGLAGTSSVGTVTPQVSNLPSGLAGTSAVGTSVPAVASSPSGIAGTGNVGTGVAEVDFAITGVAGAGSAGTPSNTVAVSATGNAGTGLCGTGAGAVDCSASGVAGNGQVGSVTASGSSVAPSDTTIYTSADGKGSGGSIRVSAAKRLPPKRRRKQLRRVAVDAETIRRLAEQPAAAPLSLEERLAARLLFHEALPTASGASPIDLASERTKREREARLQVALAMRARRIEDEDLAILLMAVA